MECSESAFLREGALFVYFCKTGSLLGYENDGQYSNFGYKDKKFNTGNPIRFNKGLTVKGNPFFILIFMLDMAHDVWYDNSYKYEKYERRKRQWKFPKGIISSVR